MTHSCQADVNIQTHFQLEKHIVFHFLKKSVRTRCPTLLLHFVSRSYPRILEGSSPIASQSPPGPARTPPVLYLFSFPFFGKVGSYPLPYASTSLRFAKLPTDTRGVLADRFAIASRACSDPASVVSI